MWTCKYCNNSKNADIEDSCSLCEKRKVSITDDSKPGEAEYPEKNYIGNTTTAALGTTGSTILDRKAVPEPIENSPLPEGNSVTVDNVDNVDEEAQILKVMKFGYSRMQAVQIREQQKIFSSKQRPSSNPQSSRASAALSRSNAAIAIASPSTRSTEPEVRMEKIFYQDNPLDGRSKTDENAMSTPEPLSPQIQLVQDLTSLGIDEEVCKALQDLDLLDIDGLKYIINRDVKEIADELNVTVGKVIPAKFKERVDLYLERFKSAEGTPARSIGSDNDDVVGPASTYVARKIDWAEPADVKNETPFWACQRCTVHNPIGTKSCSMCFSAREDSSDSLKGPFSTDDGRPFAHKSSPQDLSKHSSKPFPVSVPKDDPWSSQSSSSAYRQQEEVLKPIVFDKVNSYTYWLLTGTGNASQYSLGAVSACTTMAVQAAYSLLRNVRGKNMPFGINSEILDGILKVGAKYQNSNHQDILEVLKSSTDLSRTLLHLKGSFAKNGMVDLDFSDPYPALTIGNDLKNKYGTNVCAIITCQAQSVCLFYDYHSDCLILFDSHSRMYNGVNHGAAMLFFERMDALIAYLKLIFPAVEQPDIRFQSEMEQLQYAHMMLAQADFLCLRAAVTVFPGDNVESIPQDNPRKSWDAPSHVPFHPQGTAPPPAAQINHDNGNANQIAQVYATLFAEQKAAAEKLHDASIKATRLETELKHEKEVVVELKKRVDQLEKENKALREENTKLKEKKPFQQPHHYPARKPPNARMQQNPHQQPHPQQHLKAPLQPAEPVDGKMPAYSYKDDELLARKLMEEDMRANNDMIYAQKLQEEEERNRRDIFERDVEIARRFESDAEAARLQAERVAAEERRLLEDSEFARKIAEAGIFRCVVCMDDVSIEDVFDLDHDNHKICRDCATAYVNNALRDKNVPIKCPFDRCTHIISEPKCFEVLDEGLHGDWFDLSRRPHGDPGFRQCPVPDCKGFDLLDVVNTGDCRCYTCEHHWCCNCQVDLEQSQHKNITCEKYQEWKRNNDTGDDQMEDFLRQGLNDSEGLFRMRRCPKCRMAFMKDTACMHVVCLPLGGGCGTHFCFRCAQFHAEDATSIYNHQGTCPGFQAAP